VSKVRRGGSRKTTRRRSSRSSAATPVSRRLRNWAQAQIRSARYRAANAARLAGFALAGILGLTFAGLFATGHLDDFADAAGREAQTRLAGMGFAVEAVDVTGAGAADAARIAEAAGVFAGQPIFAVDPRAVRDRVEALPDIRRAYVARLWPNRIHVVVETRSPYALWQNEGELNIIDADGVVMAQADVYDPPALPLVVDSGANAAVTEIVEALSDYPQIAAHVVGSVRVSERRWNLRLESGADVKLPEGDVRASLAILAGLHADRGVLGYQAESFDLRGQGDLIVRALPERARAIGMGGREA